MGFASLMGNVQRLMASAEALAAIGAELRLRQSSSECDPQVRKLLQRIIEFIDPALLDGVEPQQQAIVLNGISSYFRQAADLLENPARPPGWMVHDPAVLQAQGRASARIVHHINGLGATRTALLETLNEPGAFLDVGTGCGWLAIEAARLWPKMRVVGIDPWELVLELARKNVADSGVGDRIELRKLGAEALNESDAYTLVWFASPFIPPAISRQAAQRSVRALRPGGWMIFGLYASLPDALGESLAALRVVRSGGYPWMPAETESFLRDCGLELIETVRIPGEVAMPVIGRRPLG
jgi:SAM-dependent methyltransferase